MNEKMKILIETLTTLFVDLVSWRNVCWWIGFLGWILVDRMLLLGGIFVDRIGFLLGHVDHRFRFRDVDELDSDRIFQFQMKGRREFSNIHHDVRFQLRGTPELYRTKSVSSHITTTQS